MNCFRGNPKQKKAKKYEVDDTTRESDCSYNKRIAQEPQSKEVENTLNEIKDLCQKFKESMIAYTHIKYKDLALILGVQGVGKSTFFNFLNGLKFEVIDKGKISKRLTVQNKENIISEMSEEFQAKTKKVIFFESSYKNKLLNICDTPGFLDSNGFFGDLINTFATKQVINNAKSIKIMLMIDQNQYAIAGGKAQYFKDFIGQLVQMFQQFQNYQDSFLIVFNYMKKSDEQSEIVFAIKQIEKIKNSIQEQQIKDFCELIKKQLEQKQYLIFDPEEHNEDTLNQYLEKIHCVTKSMNQQQINNCIRYSLNSKSESDFKCFLEQSIESLKFFIHNSLSKQASEILICLYELTGYVKLEIVSEKYKKAKEELYQLESLVEKFYLQFKNFVDIQSQDHELVRKSLLEKIRNTLNFYLIIELFQNQTGQELKVVNKIEQITCQIKQFMDRFVELAIGSTSFQFKFLQLEKLKCIYENKEFMQDFESITTQFKQLKVPLFSDVFSQKKYEIVQKDIDEKCQILSNKINQMLKDKVIPEDFKEILKNLKFIHDKQYDKNSRYLDYVQLQKIIKEQIIQFISEIEKLKLKNSNLITESYIGSLSKNFQFIKQISSSYYTDEHFQNQQKEYLQCQQSIRQALNQLYIESLQVKEFNCVYKYLKLIHFLTAMDDEITQQVIQNNQNYIKFEKKIYEIFKEQQQNYLQQFQRIKLQMNEHISNIYIQVIPIEFLAQVKQMAINIQNLSDASYWTFTHIQKMIKECEQEQKKHFIIDIESEIDKHIGEKDKIIKNFKLIQILVECILGYCEQNTDVEESQQQIQQQQMDFLHQFSRWCNNLISLEQLQSTQKYDLTELDKLNDSILNIENFQNFLQNLKVYIQKNVEKIYQKVIQRSEQLKKQDKNVLQQIANNNYDLQIFGQIEQRIQEVKQKLKQLQNFVVDEFKKTYQIDLENLEELKKQNIYQINIILDRIKELYDSNYPFINKLFKTNKYKEAQKIIQEDLHKKFYDNRQISDNQLDYKKQNLQKIENNQNVIKAHLNGSYIDIEQEKIKLDAVEQSLNQNMQNLLFEDKYKQASEFIKQLDQSQQDKFNKLLEKKLELTVKQLGEIKNNFIKSPSSELSQKFIHLFMIFNEIITHFSNISPQLSIQVNTYIKQINQKLILRLFSQLNTSVEEQNNFNYNNTLITIAKLYFQNLEKQQNTYSSDKKEDELIQNQSNLFKEQIIETFQIVKNKLQNKKELNQDLHNCYDVLIHMYSMMEDINQQNILKDKVVNQTFQQMKKDFCKIYLIEQTKRYTNKNNIFQEDQIEQYMEVQFLKIWEFFITKEKEKKKIISKFINDQKKLFQEVDKLIKVEDISRLLALLQSFEESILIQNKIKKYFEEKQSLILTEYIPQNNFQKVKHTLVKFNQFEKFYKHKHDQNQMGQYISSIQENITNEIIQIWNQLKEKNINKPYQIQQSLRMVEKLMIIIKDCDIIEISKEVNLKNLITLLQDSLNQKLNEINLSINQFDHEQTIKIFLDLKNALDQKVSFMNKKRNYVMVYEKILRLSFEQNIIQQQIMGQGETLIGKFQNINQLFNNLINDKINNLSLQFKDFFQFKQFEKIIQIQQSLQIFCSKVNQKQKLVEDNKALTYTNLIQEEYENQYKRASLISKSSSINLQEINLIYQTLKEIEDNFKQLSKTIQEKNYSQEITKIFQQQIQLKMKQIESFIENFQNDNQSRQLFVQNLIEVYKSTMDFKIPGMDGHISNLIQKATQNQEMNIVLDLLYYLNQDEAGSQLQDKHQKLFKQWFNELYNAKTAGQNNIQYVQKHLITKQAEGDIQFVKDDLLKQYTYYKQIYDNINQEVAQAKQDRVKLTSSITKKAQQFKQNGSYLNEKYIIWSNQQKKQLLEILAEVSAVWSIIDRQESDTKPTRFIHTIQVITIMRLLNIDSVEKSQLYNHIAQVRTGEGKSIALGITSTIFALIGFEVDCCCYSQYLSERDYNDFESFFINFSVQKQIQYNTFYKLTEKIINEPKDLRTTFENYLSSQSPQIKHENNNQKGKKILIIDEIDFFFGENFLGQVYAVGSQYKSEKIVNLMKLIWKQRLRGIDITEISKTNEYKQLLDSNHKLQQMKDFINQKIEQMIKDARSMEKHTYLLDRVRHGIERVIAYQEIDGISHNSVKGYKTAFAYLQEWQRKKISTEQLNNRLSLNFNIGCFSYPKIIDCYSLVLGVTGTLQDMTQFQVDKMKSLCNIQKQTITPSIYGESKFQFDTSKHVFLYSKKKDYFKQIFQQIDGVISQNRSVIVFFENQQTLFEYQKYSQQNNIKDLQILVEQTYDKKSLIAKATYCRTITLCTKPFGRGTDFKCYDKALKNKGGLHIIQTFLSETIAEQIQIQGRTARQGDPGSYSLVVLLQDLKNKFNVQDQSIPNKDIYKYLDNLRVQFQGVKDKELDQKQKDAEIYYGKSMELKDLLNQKYQNINRINELLKEISVYGDSKENKISKPNEKLNQINEEEMINAKDKDRFHIAKDKKFDLAKDGSSKDLSILIGQFCNASDCNVTIDIQLELKASLNQKGYKQFEIATDEKTFTNLSSEFDQLWVISGSQFISKEQNIEQDFVNCILKHLKQRKGLFLLTDNDPFFYHANLILKKVPIGYDEQTPVYMKLEGEDIGNNILKKGKYSNKLEFGYHNITHGLSFIFEGDSISYPKIINNKIVDSYDDFLDLEIIGTSQTNRPCIFALNGTNKRGRIAFDCGFTKILSLNWNTTPGTSRYIQNIYSWLYFLDREED